jgi:phage-related protein
VRFQIRGTFRSHLLQAANVRARRILVLHGFIKRTQKTPPDDLALARRRNREFEK